MATYYFDSDLGSDNNSGTSETSAWRLWDAKRLSITADDILYFKRNTTQVVTTLFAQFQWGNRVLAYGYGPRPRWVAQGQQAVTGSMILNFSGTRGITVEDQDFDATGLTRSLYCAAQGGNVTTNTKFRRCLFRNSNGNGVDVNHETGATVTPSNYLFEDCEFFNNGGHGSLVMGLNHTFLRCKAYNNGATVATGAHGFSARANGTGAYSGWSLVSGTIYSRPLNAYETTVYNVSDLGGLGALVQNTATPTAPAAGQWGQSGATLYINVNANANNRNISYQWSVTSGLQYLLCEAWSNIWFRAGLYREGHGFAADDWTSNSVYEWCLSRNNEGAGFSFNRGSNNKLYGCVARNNGQTGLNANFGSGHSVINCTFIDNNKVAPTSNYEIGFGGATTQNCLVANCVVAGSGSAGILFDAAAPGTVNACAINGFSAATQNATVSNTISSDVRSLIKDDGELVVPDGTQMESVNAANILAVNGAYYSGITLKTGRLRPGYACIGARQAVTSRTPR